MELFHWSNTCLITDNKLGQIMSCVSSKTWGETTTMWTKCASNVGEFTPNYCEIHEKNTQSYSFNFIHKNLRQFSQTVGVGSGNRLSSILGLWIFCDMIQKTFCFCSLNGMLFIRDCHSFIYFPPSWISVW